MSITRFLPTGDTEVDGVIHPWVAPSSIAKGFPFHHISASRTDEWAVYARACNRRMAVAYEADARKRGVAPLPRIPDDAPVTGSDEWYARGLG